MAGELTPKQAAEVAASAYAMRLSADLIDAMIVAPSIVRDDFDIAAGQRLTGWTGIDAPGLRHGTGFGYIARGGARRPKECLVSIRGTFMKSSSDWMTNLRAAVTPGPNGFPVHAGFLASLDPILRQVDAALRQKPAVAVHIVGHSLGGAIATLLAEALSGDKLAIKLYTFGAPRSGLESQARFLTGRLGSSNIYRAYHHTDIVPMVPVYPFAHVPADALAGRLRGPGTLVSVDAHAMTEYHKSVEEYSWASLPIYRMEHGSFAEAAAWLSAAADSSSPSIRLSAKALHLLLSGLDWILQSTGRQAGLEITAGMTLVDGLAKLLYSGALESLAIKDAVHDLLAATLRFVGKTMQAGTRITVVFIGFVLETLFRFLVAIATQALQLLD